MKVAFLDEAPGGRQYSVFIRGTGAPPEGLESQTFEIYRWGMLICQPPYERPDLLSERETDGLLLFRDRACGRRL